MVICLERGADLHMAQLMPLPLTDSCFSKIQIGFTILVPAHLGSAGKGPLNGCVCVCVTYLLLQSYHTIGDNSIKFFYRLHILPVTQRAVSKHWIYLTNCSYIAGTASVESLVFCKLLYTVQSTELEICTHNYSEQNSGTFKDLLHQVSKFSSPNSVLKDFPGPVKTDIFCSIFTEVWHIYAAALTSNTPQRHISRGAIHMQSQMFSPTS